ncbi:MAG: hypothetical protein R3B47_14465 [Bacteroidia bacterium]
MITSHRQLRSLKVIFDEQLPANKLPAFRGAVAKRVGRQHTLFHNHQDGGFRYSYPLVQYTLDQGRPTLFCLGEGVDEVHHYFQKADWSLEVHGRQLNMRIHDLRLRDNTPRNDQKSCKFIIFIATGSLTRKTTVGSGGIHDQAARLEFPARQVGWQHPQFCQRHQLAIKPERLEIQSLYLAALAKQSSKGAHSFSGRFPCSNIIPARGNWIGKRRECGLGAG